VVIDPGTTGDEYLSADYQYKHQNYD
jgi:hypothetical protein